MTERESVAAGGMGRVRRWRGLRVAVIASALGLALTGTIASPASATDYPSWSDLQKAKSDTASAQAAVSQIIALIADLKVKVVQAQALAQKRGEELEVAQNKYDDAVRRAESIQAQADESKKEADAATAQAGQLAAQLYRTGGTDLSANLVFEANGGAKGTDELLSKLGNMSKLVERSSDIYVAARTAANTAASLGQQAKLAQAEREKLRIAAEQALQAAVDAQAAVEAALAESQSRSIVLDQQLKFLRDKQAKVASAYEAGVQERARQAAAAAAAAAAANGGSGAGLPGGAISSQGWAVPAGGRITDGFGPRPVICGNDGCSGGFHYGADIGAGCGSGIYAAASGTVVYAGWYGTYGNFILIDHGNGVQTGYAHIRPGGIWVGNGQWVNVGQNIASVGETGAATGCHLHFELRLGGNRVSPFGWMADRGAPLG